MGVFVLCSDCFKDQGLKLDAITIGVEDNHAPVPDWRSRATDKFKRKAIAAITNAIRRAMTEQTACQAGSVAVLGATPRDTVAERF
jgi:hypothetical protein